MLKHYNESDNNVFTTGFVPRWTLLAPIMPLGPSLHIYIMNQPWKQGSWDHHGAHLGPIGPRWAPWWTHEHCYMGKHNRPWWIIGGMHKENRIIEAAILNQIYYPIYQFILNLFNFIRNAIIITDAQSWKVQLFISDESVTRLLEAFWLLDLTIRLFLSMKCCCWVWNLSWILGNPHILSRFLCWH